jgi:cyanophycinase
MYIFRGVFMQKRNWFNYTAVLLLLTVGIVSIAGFDKPGSASAQEAPEYGPASGKLVIVGGGPLNNTGIVEKFIELAGGPDARFVIVPTAGGNRTPTGEIKIYKEEEVIASWKKRGLKNVRMLHTHDPKVADRTHGRA